MTKMHLSAQDSEGNKADLNLDTLDKRLKEVETVTVKNGETRTMPITQVVAETWEAVQPLRHLNTIVKIVKQYPKLTKFVVRTGGLILAVKILRLGIENWNWLVETFNKLM